MPGTPAAASDNVPTRGPDMLPRDEFASRARVGTGSALAVAQGSDADLRTRAYAAALADVLASVARDGSGAGVEAESRSSTGADSPGLCGTVRTRTLSGRAGDFRVWRQRAVCGPIVLSDVVLVERLGRYLVTVSGRLERMDPGFPLPDRSDPRTEVDGLHVADASFESVPGGVRCRLLLAPEPSAQPDPVDGIVVDARGCDFGPERVLRIVDQDGGVVYAPEMVSADVIVRRGMAVFTTTPEKAESLLAALGGHRALTVRCLRATSGGALMLSRDGAAAARRADRGQEIFENARVVVLVRGAN